LELLATIKKITKWKTFYPYKKSKALFATIIKSIFINILHKLKKEKYIVGTCFA